jgi:hypothetical protein
MDKGERHYFNRHVLRSGAALEFVADIVEALHDDGLWVFEQSYLPSMLATNSYDYDMPRTSGVLHSETDPPCHAGTGDENRR